MVNGVDPIMGQWVTPCFVQAQSVGWAYLADTTPPMEPGVGRNSAPCVVGQHKNPFRVQVCTPYPLPGEPPSPTDPPRGCPFHPRCPLTRELARALPPAQTTTILGEGVSIEVAARCVLQTPTLRPTKDAPSHLHACFLRQI